MGMTLIEQLEIRNTNELIDSLLIVNVENFWKNSKFLVLEVK